jgi:hypothetical protein
MQRLSFAVVLVLSLALGASAIKCSVGFTCDKGWRPASARARAGAGGRGRALRAALLARRANGPPTGPPGSDLPQQRMHVHDLLLGAKSVSAQR